MSTTVAAVFGLFACAACALGGTGTPNVGGSAAAPGADAQEDILIVYLSRTGNTKAVAEIIHELVGGDLLALELETPYPDDYDAIVAQVDEENEKGHLPTLKSKVEDIHRYETVFLGFPTWDMQLPPPMKTFLHEYDLRDKTVVPFNTNAMYGVGSSFRDVEERSPGARILEGLSVRGGFEKEGLHLVIEGERKNEVRDEVIQWLRRIRVLQ